MEVYFHKKAKAPYQSFTFKQIYEHGVNAVTGTGTATDEEAFFFCFFCFFLLLLSSSSSPLSSSSSSPPS